MAQTPAGSGSTGGVIGNRGKSASGSVEPTAGVPKTHHRKMRTSEISEKTSKRTSCGNIVGTWSWSGGLFGADDTTFNADGTAVHKSGITGTWKCRAGGEIYIDWKDWYKNRMKLSPDGHTLTNLEGGSTFSR
jgi:hypothetical protein